MLGWTRSGLLALALVLAGAAAGKAEVYLQIEAQPTPAQARAAAERYAAAQPNVVGYALGSGWYAIALGPYADRTTANAARRVLRAAGAVPSDAFVVEASRTAARFWPPEGSRPSGTVEPIPPAPATTADTPAPVDADPAPETLAQARRGEATLDAAARADVQQALAWFGHYALGIDGAFGPGTRRAMEAWQAAAGHPVTGVLTSHQRADLLQDWQEAKARFGFAPWRDEAAGIEVTLPLGLLGDATVSPPFVQFLPREDTGPEVLLISQKGSRPTLAALQNLIAASERFPGEVERRDDPDSFKLRSGDGARRAHAFARHQDGRIKGFLAVWSDDADMTRLVTAMTDSLRDLGGALPDSDTTGQDALLAHLDAPVRGTLVRSATGFFVDTQGRVLTTAEAVEGCGRVGIDQHHPARITLQDPAIGVALLEPESRLAPAAHARFRTALPAPDAEVVLAGFALPEMVVPVLTRGRIAALSGMAGETALRRLSLRAEPGELGGPVLDRSGAVLGMLLPSQAPEGRILPDGVAFAAGAEAIVAALSENGIAATEAGGPETSLEFPDLMRKAAGLAVQVSCWE
ncbi:MAG: serine protease [Alkalilacustris sp.]